MTFKEFVMSQTDKIIMQYKNENSAEQGEVEQSIEISAPSEIIKMFNLRENTNTSLSENISQLIKSEDVGKEFNFDITLINNKDTEITRFPRSTKKSNKKIDYLLSDSFCFQIDHST